MKRLAFLVALTGCAQQSPRYAIVVSGTNDTVDVDTAWERASELAEVNPDITKNQWVTATFQTEPITISSSTEMYHGISSETFNTIQVIDGCLLDIETPTVHEFLHTIYFIKYGDNDPNHTRSPWHRANENFGPCQKDF